MTRPLRSISAINKTIVECNLCPRLRAHCSDVAKKKRKAYENQTYWGRPVPGFGDPKARLVVIGLAPAAHGANRTGRMFTGDRSGDWLYRALWKAGFANQPESIDRKDGLKLKDCYISAAARCAPPLNKPTPDEIQNCLGYLKADIQTLRQGKVYLVLGGIALNSLWPVIKSEFDFESPKPKFGHNARFGLPEGKHLLMSYHPSQQNTFTGRLTEKMFDSVFETARRYLKARPQS